jgi:hypothetical protein
VRGPFLGVVVVLAFSLVACSGSSEVERGARVAARRTTTVPNRTVSPTTTVEASKLGTCARTLLPVYADRRVYRTPQPDDVPDPLIPGPPGGSEELRVPKSGVPTDGDGNAVVPVDSSIEVRRPDGTLTFASPGGFVHMPNGLADFGDLNGDGRADHVVVLDDAFYMLSGALAPGTHDPRTAGVRIANVQSDVRSIRPVGDQDGDRADDVALGDELYSGRSLMSRRQGRSVALPRPFRSVAGLSGVLQLTPTGRPALVQAFGAIPVEASPPDDPFVLRIDGDVPACLATDNIPDSTAPALLGVIDGWMVDGHRIVELTRDTRNSFVVYRWDLDA